MDLPEGMDRRLTPARNEVAADFLEGKVLSQRFVKGAPKRIAAPVASLRASPSDSAGQDTQALFGEIFNVYDTEGDWSWGQLDRDGYVGWIKSTQLRDDIIAPTHVVTALRTIVFSKADLKSPAQMMLSLNTHITVDQQEGDYVRLATGGWVHGRHLRHMGESPPLGFVGFAEQFLGTPYLWGGNSSLGLDCSGLLQSAMMGAGRIVPRDADMQEKAVGDALPLDNGLPALVRGDLVFWPGHVGIMQDEKTLLHANAYHMVCAREPLSDAIKRIENNATDKKKGTVRSIKRPQSVTI